jgi:hypothetical protein
VVSMDRRNTQLELNMQKAKAKITR